MFLYCTLHNLANNMIKFDKTRAYNDTFLRVLFIKLFLLFMRPTLKYTVKCKRLNFIHHIVGPPTLRR